MRLDTQDLREIQIEHSAEVDTTCSMPAMTRLMSDDNRCRQPESPSQGLPNEIYARRNGQHMMELRGDLGGGGGRRRITMSRLLTDNHLADLGDLGVDGKVMKRTLNAPNTKWMCTMDPKLQQEHMSCCLKHKKCDIFTTTKPNSSTKGLFESPQRGENDGTSAQMSHAKTSEGEGIEVGDGRDDEENTMEIGLGWLGRQDNACE
jgi:hypothetical protein